MALVKFSARRVRDISLAWLTAALFALGACTDETTSDDEGGTGGSASGAGGSTSTGGSTSGGSTSTGGAGSANGGASGVTGAGTAGVGTSGSSSGGSATGGSSGSGSGSDAGGAAGASGAGGAGASGAGAGGTGAGGAGAGGASNGGAGAGGRGGNAGSGGSMAGRGGMAGGGAGGASGAGGGSSYQPCPATGACKIMPFGDSITEGYPNGGGYRIELFRLAHQAGRSITFVGSVSNGPTMVDGVAFPRNHEGHGGYTISGNNGIAQFVQPSMQNYMPHIITLMIGTNDLNGNIDVANAPMRLGALLDSIYTQNGNVLVILAQIVPSRTDSLNQRIQTYNAAMPALVTSQTNRGRHIVLIDQYGAFTRDTNYKTTLLGDNLHPNDAGYVRMGETWYAALMSYLR